VKFLFQPLEGGGGVGYLALGSGIGVDAREVLLLTIESRVGDGGEGGVVDSRHPGDRVHHQFPTRPFQKKYGLFKRNHTVKKGSQFSRLLSDIPAGDG
jgi:hypothetical protein